jgi:hypothetical protein
LKQEIAQREHRQEEQRFAAAFREVAQDEERLEALREWESLDEEGWEG